MRASLPRAAGGFRSWTSLPPAGVGIALLFAIIASHALVETARDALFLRDLPAERLPWAYLAIAVGVLASSRLIERGRARWSRAQLLRGLLLLGAAGHLAFCVLEARRSAAVLMALYVWCGLLTTQLVVQLWLIAADSIDVGGAKRAFARIAAGGLAGAAAGGGAALLLLTVLPVVALLPAAAAVLLGAVVLSLRLPSAAPAGAPSAAGEVHEPPSLRSVLADKYAARVLAAGALVAALATGIDFLFKKVVAQEISPEQLGMFFAFYQAASNAGALLLQVALTPWLLQRFGVTRALLVLPALLGLGAGSLAANGGLAIAVGVKLLDGVLGQSLHRAAGEILFLPVAEPMRGTLRALAASLGQRTGQALASLGLLGAAAAGLPLQVVAGATAAVAAALVAVTLGLEGPYVERFRAGLRSLGRDTPREVPRLDLRALESLVSALSSPEPEEVVAAMDLLDAYGRSHLVPPLVLYHPTPRVVIRALEIFREHPAAGVDPLMPWLLAHPDAEVRAAALRARGITADAEMLRKLLLGDADPLVRAAAFAELAQRDLLSFDHEQEVLATLLASPGDSLPALARAAAALPVERGLPWLEGLAGHADPTVQRALAEEIARAPAVAHLPLLLRLLAHPDSREAARSALVALGRPALEALSQALRDRATPRRVRRHLPRSVSRFPDEAASRILTDALASEDDPRVRFKILRGLGRMRSDRPDLAIDAKPVAALAELSLRRAVEMLVFQVVLRASGGSAGDTELLGRLLLEKEERALERVFRALHILDPSLEFRALFEALRAEQGAAQAAAREVLEHVVEAPLRDGVLAVVSPGSAEKRLAGALRFHAPEGAAQLLEAAPAEGRVAPSLDAFWRAMETDEDPVLAALAVRTRAMARGDLHAG